MTETSAPKSRRIAARVAVAAALTLGPAAMLAAPALAAPTATPIDWDHGHGGGWDHRGGGWDHRGGDWDHHGHDWDHHGWDHPGGWYAPPTGSF